MDLIGRKISVMLTNEKSYTGVIKAIHNVGDQEFIKFNTGRLINTAFILEIYLYGEATILQFRPKSIIS